MAQLTLRTLLAYLDDTLEPALARQLGAKVADSEVAQKVIERIKKVTRRRGLRAPTATPDDDGVSDPNTVAEYLSDTLDSDQVTRLEETCLESDAHLAEVAACHQILTMLLTEPVRVPPRARQRMYKIVPPPASVPGRRPGKTLPVGGVMPPAADKSDHDDADAALLLGMGRYTAGSLLGRVALVAGGLAAAAVLAVAVVMALPHRPSAPPETSPGGLYAAADAAPPPLPAPPPPTLTPVAPPPTEVAVKVPEMPPDPPVKPPEKDPVPAPKAPAAPREDRVPLGKVEALNAIVLARADGGPAWLRLDPAGDAGVTGQNQVLALPGYKTDVLLDTGVKVHLWGNVPELFPARLLEALVRFHQPERKVGDGGGDFDADLTLLAGRVYLTTTRPAGARVRVRVAGQVWDVSLPDTKTDVLVEVITTFEPGAPFVRDGGTVRVEAQVAVLRGAAGLAVAGRAKPFEKVVAPAVFAWDSKTGTLTGPKPIDPANAYFDKFPLVGSKPGELVQKALTDMAGRLKAPNGVKLMLAEILTEPPEAGRIVVGQMAVYSQTATLYGDAAGDDLKPLIDILNDDTRGYARQVVVNALAAWAARSPANSALLEKQFAAKTRREGEPELLVRMLRGTVAPAKPDPAELDRLVEHLDYPSVAVRELALWNLINFADPEARKVPGLVTDVAFLGPPHDKFVRAWRVRVEEIKKGPPPKK